jgi:2-oxoglutarate dehydrogenase E2 component (dihydrolipoamide succinyltransferase)
MSAEVVVPQLGESVVEATVGHWLKEEGATVAMGEPLVELETEKINMEVTAPAAGVLQSIARAEGETVAIGDVLATIAIGAEAAASVAARPEEPAREGATTGAQSAGGRALAAAARAASDGGRATPLARHMAEERGIDLSEIHGTGAGGRITRDDVAARLAAVTDGSAAQPAATLPAPGRSPNRQTASTTPVPAPPISLPQRRPPAPPQHGVAGGREDREERVRMSRRRQTIAQRLVEAQHTAAMLTTFNEIDMSAVMALRARYKDSFQKRNDVRLGFMSFFTRAVVSALKAYPRLNAEIQGDEMVLKHYYDIGVAVSTDDGLVVPVVRDADRLSFAEIEREIARLAERARTRQLSLDDLRGGTFTITNGGVFGSLLSTPILNGPQVGILGMHKIEERPVARNGQVMIHPMMYVALSYDHRIVDGSEAVSFLVRVKELLEDSEMLLLEG